MAKLPKSLIKKYGISKKAWAIFRRQGQSGNPRTRSVRTMARRRRYSPRRWLRRRGGRRGKGPLPLLPLVGGVIAPLADSAFRSGLISSSGQVTLTADTGLGFLDQVSQHYTGFSPFPHLSGVQGFNAQYLMTTYGGLIMGAVGSKIATALGANRAMKRIPFLGRYIKL